VKRKIRSQAAMEYLMTYGWAILIIALALGVLYSLGIMNPKNFLPRAPPGSCFVFRPNGPGTTNYISLQGTCGYLPMYVGSFDGNSGYIGVPNSAILNSPSQNGKITVIAWIYQRKYLTCEIVVARKTYAWRFGTGGTWNSNLPMLEIWNASGTGFNYFGNKGVTLNQWHFLAAVWNGSNVYFYIDGISAGSVSSTTTMQTSSNLVYIGRGDGSCQGFFNGSIANVQIYNTALTPQEIQYLYQQGLGGGPVRLQNLVGWWPLNGDAKDYSGNNNHGTIYGGVTFVQNYNPP
jgi:hypothetical protein